MEIILPPIHGTTFRAQTPLFISTGVRDSSVPLCPETLSKSGIRLALSAINIIVLFQKACKKKINNNNKKINQIHIR